MLRIKDQAWAALRAKPDLPSTEPSSALEGLTGTSFLCWVFTPIREDRTKYEVNSFNWRNLAKPACSNILLCPFVFRNKATLFLWLYGRLVHKNFINLLQRKVRKSFLGNTFKFILKDQHYPDIKARHYKK